MASALGHGGGLPRGQGQKDMCHGSHPSGAFSRSVRGTNAPISAFLSGLSDEGTAGGLAGVSLVSVLRTAMEALLARYRRFPLGNSSWK